ncbi:hypothetical protein CDAR_412141 [Caerostris darwini]|uniref:Uncharacterized protein n=1 Tax=Caerostris darwini TaxID=1538125 RepID=A0AAV4WE92_9ARAC|nr:hypothetical protein CDAR_412141 [Caerostris darwini]
MRIKRELRGHDVIPRERSLSSSPPSLVSRAVVKGTEARKEEDALSATPDHEPQVGKTLTSGVPATPGLHTM